MVKRYVPRASVAFPVKPRGTQVFNPDRRGPDGLPGYSEGEIGRLRDKDHRDSFEQIEVTTKRPGEKRDVQLGNTCDECGKTFKTSRGLASHVGQIH